MGMFFRATALMSFGVMCCAHAADWPHWTGPEWRNMSDETNLPD